MMRRYVALITSLTAACVVQGVTLFDSTDSVYTSGNLDGQANWMPLLNYDTNGVPVVGADQLGTNAFSVDNSTWIANDAASDTEFLVTTNGSYVYLDEVSAGNEVYSEWSGDMDFSFGFPSDNYTALPNSTFFAIGLTSDTESGLDINDPNDICMILRYRANNRLDLMLAHGDESQGTRIFQTPSDGTTWQEPAVLLGMDPQNGDCESDVLRLSWTIRKSTEGVYTARGSISNLTTGVWINELRTNTVDGLVVSTEGLDKGADVYASSDPVFAMGRLPGAYSGAWTVNGGNGMIDLDIDSLTVVKTVVAPALAAPANLFAVPYDSQVTLSWDAAPEATSYDVFRATSSGGYSTAFTNLTETSVLDTGLVNNQDYFYVVQAVYGSVGNSTNSLEISAMPQGIFTGTLVDTDFSTYSNGDLAGQDSWLQVSGSSNNAFNVINSGTTNAAADTVSTTANFSTNTGNAVYLNKLTDNMVYDAWEGHIDFVLSAGASSKLISNQDVLVFGISADPSAPLQLQSDDNMALMSVKVRANGKLVAMLATEANDSSEADRLAVLIGETETGWEPAGQTDMESDLIRYSWKIRKSGVDGTYQAFGSFSNLTAGVTGTSQFGADYLTTVKQGLYDNVSANFVMGHYYKSQLSADNELVNVTVYDMSVTHTTDNQPVPTAPVATTLGGDRSVTVSWNETFEASDYDVLMAETAGGDQIVLESTSSLSLTDAPRFNGVTNYYTVRANFPTGSADSAEVPGAPEPSVQLFHYDGLGDMASAQCNVDQSGAMTNGAGDMLYLDFTATDMMSTAVNASYTGPTLHGIIQRDNVEGYVWGTHRIANDYTWIVVADHIDFNCGNSSGWQNYMVYSEAEESINLVEGEGGSFTLKIAHEAASAGFRVAIRDGAQWYVSQSVMNGGSALQSIVLTELTDTMWAAIPADPAVAFVDPTSFTTDASTFSDVNAAGFFGVTSRRARVYEMQLVKAGSTPSKEYWMTENGVTDLYADDNGNGVINLKEYAFNRDPNTDEGLKNLPQFTPAEYMGTNGFTFVNVELRDPEPGVSYALETTTDLVNTLFGPDASVTKIGESNIDYYTKAVTNFIPATADAKFIDLKVNEL